MFSSIPVWSISVGVAAIPEGHFFGTLFGVCFFIGVKTVRKIIAFVFTFAVLLYFCVYQRNYSHAVYTVSIEENLVTNHSVGNDWQKSYTCNGKIITNGYQWTVPLDTTETITIEATITEIDECCDIGNGSISIILKDGYKASTHITVTEDKGRYKGNQAIWEIVCEVELTDKISGA